MKHFYCFCFLFVGFATYSQTTSNIKDVRQLRKILQKELSETSTLKSGFEKKDYDGAALLLLTFKDKKLSGSSVLMASNPQQEKRIAETIQSISGPSFSVAFENETILIPILFYGYLERGKNNYRSEDDFPVISLALLNKYLVKSVCVSEEIIVLKYFGKQNPNF